MITTLRTLRSLPRIVTRGVLSVFWGVESNFRDLGDPQVSLNWHAYIQVVLKVGSTRMVAKRVASRDSQFDAYFRESLLCCRSPSNSIIRLVPRACEGA